MTIFKKVIKILTLLNFVFYSYASTYMVKAPQTPYSEFLSYLQSESSLPYVQKQEESLKQNLQSEKEDVLSLLEQAQESFLKDHLKNSSEYFNSIVQKAFEKDWDEETRKIIFYSFLRLAQIEGKGEFPESFLHSSVVFAPDLEPDTNLFPPPLVEKFNQIKANLPLLNFRLGKIFSNHEKVFINGREVPLNEKIQLPYGNYRITALSSSHKPWSQVISLSELIRKQIVTASWVRGGCALPYVSQNVQNYEVLFPHSCVWKSLPVSGVRNQQLEKILTEEKDSFNFKKHSKWFWISGGIGVTVITLVALNSKNSNSPTRPSSSVIVGF